MTLLISTGLFAQNENIPQGNFEYELYFSEWEGRMENTPCSVKIHGNRIEVYKNENTNISGERLIVKGILVKHKSGKWIIANSESDKNAEEIGGCTGGPIPIDFKSKVIEWC